MPDELTIIKQLKQRDETALTVLYDKYSGALYGVILRICKDDSLAQDLLQETFVKIWQKAISYDSDKGKFYTWAYRIARNTTLNALRNRSKLIQTDDLSVYNSKEETPSSDIDVAKLNGSINKLEPHHKRALQLIYFNGLTHREAHEVMDVPLGTFKSYVRQALTKLRELYGVGSVILMMMMT